MYCVPSALHCTPRTPHVSLLTHRQGSANFPLELTGPVLRTSILSTPSFSCTSNISAPLSMPITLEMPTPGASNIHWPNSIFLHVEGFSCTHGHPTPTIPWTPDIMSSELHDHASYFSVFLHLRLLPIISSILLLSHQNRSSVLKSYSLFRLQLSLDTCTSLGSNFSKIVV